MKKTKKMSFSNIKDVLSRDEMRKIMAGSGGGGCSVCTWGPVEFCQYDTKFGCVCNSGTISGCN